MMLALLVLLAQSALLRDEVDVIPPGQWRFDEFLLNERLPATVDCRFRGKARVELLSEENLQLLLHHSPHEAIESSDSGTLRYQIGVPGRFAVVVFNDDKQREVRVPLKLSLDFSVDTTYLPPERRLTVILLSFFGFLAIVTLSARKLLIAMRRT